MMRIARMNTAATTSPPQVADAGVMMKVFTVFAALALLSGAISLGGKLLGGTIAAVGYTADTTPYEIVVGNNVLSVPGNMIRFEEARRHGDAHRVDLYALWPKMTGYSDADRDAFNNRQRSRRIVFMSIEPRMMSRDMSGRLDAIYRRLIDLPGAPGPAGLRRYSFSAGSGYVDEVLVVGERPGREAFVARCLTGSAAAETLAGCERDVHLGQQLSMTYRFPEELLENWAALDAAVSAKAAEMLRTGR
jgi:hypothetical protein